MTQRPPELITDNEVARYEQLRTEPPGDEFHALAERISTSRRWWRQVGEFAGTRNPGTTIEVSS